MLQNLLNLRGPPLLYGTTKALSETSPFLRLHGVLEEAIHLALAVLVVVAVDIGW